MKTINSNRKKREKETTKQNDKPMMVIMIKILSKYVNYHSFHGSFFLFIPEIEFVSLMFQ